MTRFALAPFVRLKWSIKGGKEVSAVYGRLAGTLRLVQPTLPPVTGGRFFFLFRAGGRAHPGHKQREEIHNSAGRVPLVGGVPHLKDAKPGETIDIRPLNIDINLTSQERANAR